MKPKPNTQILSAFGKRLAELRNQKKISQAELGGRINSSQNQIYRIENGMVNTSLINIVMLSHALGVNPCELLKFEISKEDINVNM